MESRKPTPQEIVSALEEEELRDECDRAAAMSDAAIDHELERRGVDPRALRAGANAVFERAMRRREEARDANAAKPDSHATPLASTLAGSRARTWGQTVAWTSVAAIAASAAVVVGVHTQRLGLWGTRQGGQDGMAAGPRPRGHDHDDAERLRDDATTLCRDVRWAACKAKLDEAQRIDPAGESTARVKGLREAIEAASRLGQ